MRREYGDHVNECMTYRNRLKAFDAEIPRGFFVQKLLDVDKECMFMSASLREQLPKQIVVALMEQYPLFQRHRDIDRPCRSESPEVQLASRPRTTASSSRCSHRHRWGQAALLPPLRQEEGTCVTCVRICTRR